MPSRKKKTMAKKAHKNLQVEASLGSKKALKAALKEAGKPLGAARSLVTDEEAERIMRQATQGTRLLSHAFQEVAKRANKRAAAPAPASETTTEKYARAKARRTEGARKTNQTLRNREGGQRLNDLVQMNEKLGEYMGKAARNRNVKQVFHHHDPLGGDVVQLGQGQDGDRVVVYGVAYGQSPKFDKQGRMVMDNNTRAAAKMYTVDIRRKVLVTKPNGQKVLETKSFIPGWDQAKTMEEKEMLLRKHFADMVENHMGQKGELMAFYFDNRKRKDNKKKPGKK